MVHEPPATAAAPSTSAPPLVSLVVPTLDEERALPGCLASVAAQEGPIEVIVADGGSADATVAIARAHGARVIEAPRGRGRQLQAGAATAEGAVLLFVHADSRLPGDAVRRLRAAVARGVQGGAYTLRFDHRTPSFLLGAWLGDLYCRITGDLFGDRAMFATREVFDRVGGFRDLPLMEDLDLSVRLRRAGARMALLRGPVTTSARRAREVGLWRFAWRCVVLIQAFHRGAPLDETAARFFREGKRGPAHVPGVRRGRA